ncbi:hypothetical protein ACX0G9_26050 [Flavitalea flava]
MNRLKKMTTCICLTLLAFPGFAQTSLDSVKLKTLRGAIISFSAAAQKNTVILICFWSINSENSINELNAINAHYEQWKQGAAFKLMAVCIDAGNNLNKMRPTANMNGWTFDIYADIDGDLRNILKSNNLPQSMILSGGKVVYQQSGFDPGSENYLFTKILSLTGGQNKRE